MPAYPEQFNLTKSETSRNEMIAIECYDNKSVEGKITVESRSIQIPSCPEQFSISKSMAGGDEINAFGRCRGAGIK